MGTGYNRYLQKDSIEKSYFHHAYFCSIFTFFGDEQKYPLLEMVEEMLIIFILQQHLKKNGHSKSSTTEELSLKHFLKNYTGKVNISKINS